ncbi:MAG: lactate racemase domain-containing protein [Gammaproteobacteria bacterium]|jgi:hypothetical protein|nr:lactate racemase domain-containing protein [Gammaproteobacteria bacterium]
MNQSGVKAYQTTGFGSKAHRHLVYPVRYIPTLSRPVPIPESHVDWPQFVQMRQEFDTREVTDLAGELVGGIRARLATSHAKPSESVAIGVGSRGVSPIREVVTTLIGELKSSGLRPFVVPAMGSHGGGTAEGQRHVLGEYGITESGVGAPVEATMETRCLGTTPGGVDVHLDLNAFHADHIVIIARVKPHTGFRSDIESGLCKMLAVGMGKRNGAANIHEGGLVETIPEAAAVAIDSGKVLFGVALVENAFDRPYLVRVPAPLDFHQTDRELLIEAKRILPRIPTARLDLLIVDEMGKDISGTGMDTNIIGMWRRIGGERIPDYGLLAVLRLRETSDGNAAGIGLADFTTQSLVDEIDRKQTYVNALTALAPFMARIPVTMATDRDCLEAAIGLAKRTAKSDLRVGRIKNTLELESFSVTPPVAKEMRLVGAAQPEGEPSQLRFDPNGNLSDIKP